MALNVFDCDSLVSMDGLSSLCSVGRGLEIHGNPVLSNVDGLSSLTAVGGDLSIYDNSALCQSSLLAFLALCTSCGSVMDITGNDESCRLPL